MQQRANRESADDHYGSQLRQELVKELENASLAFSTEAMRFNQDLSTLPPWLPPCSVGPHRFLLHWWCHHSGQPSPGISLLGAAVLFST